MTHVVAEPCFGCKYTDCVVVCPVECFYEGESMLYIHPEECIDCEACVPECPVEAIFHEDNLPEEWKDYTQLNAELATQCPVITEKKSRSPVKNRRRFFLKLISSQRPLRAVASPAFSGAAISKKSSGRTCFNPAPESSISQ